MSVFVKNMRAEPLMPCSNRKARILLKEGRAKIFQYNPFTIQLTIATGEVTQPVNIGVDSGAKHIGIAIVSEDKVLGKAEIELRDDVKTLLTTRRTLRRSRRNRKTRYRCCKFRYKAKRVFSLKKRKFIKQHIKFESDRSENWLPPSIQSRADNAIAWIEKFASVVPNPQITVEVGKFDVQKMMNPDIEGTQYQEGASYGFWATRYYVFARDNYTCQICGKKGGILHTHHKIPRNQGGSDRADNLATVHDTCHKDFHAGRVQHVFKKPKSYKETAFMNILRKQILARLNCDITYGNITTADRKALGLPKSHVNDAIAITGITNIRRTEDEVFYVHQARRNKRSLHEATARKGRTDPNREANRNKKNTVCQGELFLNDKVILFGQVGFISGFCQGGLYVVDIEGKYITKPGKTYKQVGCNDVKRLHHSGNWRFILKPQVSEVISPFSL